MKAFYKKLYNYFNPFVAKPRIISRHISNPDFPFLVSFPRTGSHWLRMIMELYFGKPSLVRAFYYKRAKDFTCYHTHDLELTVERENIIYLYRNPVETIYSQLCYHKQDINNEILIKYWANIYGLHLEKWLIRENFTNKKTIVTYEGLKGNLYDEFQGICLHFNFPFDKIRLDNIINKISKKEVILNTEHDHRVINLTEEYIKNKKYFMKKYSLLIFNSIYSQNSKLDKFINKTAIK